MTNDRCPKRRLVVERYIYDCGVPEHKHNSHSGALRCLGTREKRYLRIKEASLGKPPSPDLKAEVYLTCFNVAEVGRRLAVSRASAERGISKIYRLGAKRLGLNLYSQDLKSRKVRKRVLRAGIEEWREKPMRWTGRGWKRYAGFELAIPPGTGP